MTTPRVQSLMDAHLALRQAAADHPHARPLPDFVRYESEPTRFYADNLQELGEQFIDYVATSGSQRYISVSITEVSLGEFCLGVWEPVFGRWEDDGGF